VLKKTALLALCFFSAAWIMVGIGGLVGFLGIGLMFGFGGDKLFLALGIATISGLFFGPLILRRATNAMRSDHQMSGISE
jgi:hypothetical protein